MQGRQPEVVPEHDCGVEEVVGPVQVAPTSQVELQFRQGFDRSFPWLKDFSVFWRSFYTVTILGPSGGVPLYFSTLFSTISNFVIYRGFLTSGESS